MALVFEVNLGGNVKTEAGSAAHQVSVLQKQLQGLQVSMIKAQAAGENDKLWDQIKQYNKLSDAIRDIGPQHLEAAQAAAKQAAEEKKLAAETAKAQQAAAKQAAADKKAFAKESQEAQKKANDDWAASVKSMQLAAVAAAAAIVAMAAAVIYAGAKLAVMSGEARLAFGATALALAGTQAAADGVVGVIDKLAMQLPLTKEALRGLTQEFMVAGIKDGPRLEKALRATAAATALLGDAAGQKVKGLVSLKDIELLQTAGQSTKQLNDALMGTGLTAEDVAKQLGTNLAGLNAKLGAGVVKGRELGLAIQDAMIKKGANAVEIANRRLEVMFDKVKTAASELFNGIVDTAGYKEFTLAVQQILLLFQSSIGTAGAFKGGLTAAFSGVFSIAAKVLTFLIISFLKLSTGAVRLYISLFPLLKGMHQAYDFFKKVYAETIKLVTANKFFAAGLQALWDAVVRIAKGFAIAFAAVGVLIGGLVAAGAIVVWLLGIVKVALGAAIDWFVTWAKKGYTVAADFVAGVVKGIKDGAKFVIDAVKGLATGALDTFKSVLKISSPSKVMMQMGVHMGQGAAQGIDASSAMVSTAAANMAGDAATSAGSSAAAPSSGGGITVIFQSGAIQINGGDGKGILELTEEALAEVLEKVAAQKGLAAA